MKAFLVLAAFAGLATARPEPPVSGYNYPSPGGFGGSHGGIIGGGSILGGGHGVNILGGGGHRGGIISSGGGGHGSGFGGSGLISSGGYEGGYAGGYSHSPIVQKHIYVHVPPPEPIEHRPQRIPHVAPPRKHYKIIFIKAPTPPTPTAPIIPIQPQDEEKTLVYVLVKKPEEQPDIIIPTAAPTQPSKPEVYFIKYKSQTESGGGIGLGGGIGGGLGGGLGGGIGGGHGGSIGGGHGGSIGGGIGLGDIGHGGSGLEAGGGQYGPPGHVPGSPVH